MSRVPLRPRIPVGLLVVDPNRPSRETVHRPLQSPAIARARQLRPALPVAVIGLLLVACVGLMTFALRPVRQGTTETAYSPPMDPPEAASDLASLPTEESDPAATRIELGEARPSAHAPERPASTDLTFFDPTDPPASQRAQCSQFGTKINFARSQSVAFDCGVREQKLVMVLHLAGNFEDPGFT